MRSAETLAAPTLSSWGTTEVSIKAGRARRNGLPDGNTKGRKNVLREDVDANPVAEPACAASVPCHLIVNQMDSVIPAAMIFDRAARLSHQLGQLWTQVSALTQKVPAPPKFSHLDAQTHRLSN